MTGAGAALRNPIDHRAGLVGSLVVHLVLLAGVVAMARRATAPVPLVYAVNLVAAPAPGRAPRRAVESATPSATPESVRPVTPIRTTTPPPAPRDAPARTEPAVPTRTDVTPLPGVQPSTGTDELTFRQDGLRFPYPEYLENIVTQIRRRWTSPTGPRLRLRVEVAFTIHRDGSVTDIGYVRRSGNLLFDASALGAVERAGRDLAFGTLPDGWNGESLPISFAFTPDDR